NHPGAHPGLVPLGDPGRVLAHLFRRRGGRPLPGDLRTPLDHGGPLPASGSVSDAAGLAPSGDREARMSLLAALGVSKSFGGLKAVQEVGFSLAEGELLALIGPNGAGKTTLFNVISGFFRPDAGRISFAGESLAGLRPHEICRRGMARTFQVTRP